MRANQLTSPGLKLGSSRPKFFHLQIFLKTCHAEIQRSIFAKKTKTSGIIALVFEDTKRTTHFWKPSLFHYAIILQLSAIKGATM